MTLLASVQGRLTRCGLQGEVDIAIARTKLFAQFRDAHEREQQLHAALRIAGYGVPAAKAREFLRSGFTECYSAVPETITERVLGLPQVPTSAFKLIRPNKEIP